MAINIAGLSTYVDQVSNPLISKAILESNTMKFIDVFQDIKYSQSINVIDLNPFTVQANSLANNGFNDSGTIVLNQINIESCPLKIQSSYILEGSGSIEQTYLGMLMKSGSQETEFPSFEEAFMELQMKHTSQAVDYALWLGSYNPYSIQYSATSNTGQTGHLSDSPGTGTTGTYGYLGGCQGLLYNILNNTSNSGATTLAYSGAPTIGTIYTILDQMTGLIPNNMLMESNISIWCQPAYVDMYRRALINLNLFHYQPDSFETGDLNLTIIGRNNVTLRGTIGLAGPTGNGYQGFILSNDQNLVAGVDNLSDYNKTQLWYSWDFQQLRSSTSFKIGGQVKFPVQVVVY
jgi:hypothetical protein